MVRLYMKRLSNMIIYDKVIRIGLNSEMFYDNVSRDFTERWVNYDDILDMPPIYKLLNIYHSEELKALKNNEIDYIALSSDL